MIEKDIKIMFYDYAAPLTACACFAIVKNSSPSQLVLSCQTKTAHTSSFVLSLSLHEHCSTLLSTSVILHCHRLTRCCFALTPFHRYKRIGQALSNNVARAKSKGFLPEGPFSGMDATPDNVAFVQYFDGDVSKLAPLNN